MPFLICVLTEIIKKTAITKLDRKTEQTYSTIHLNGFMSYAQKEIRVREPPLILWIRIVNLRRLSFFASHKSSSCRVPMLEYIEPCREIV